MKNYTQNWNQEFIKNTSSLNKMELCLEVGAFEGLTSNYIVENLLIEKGKLICIDPLTDVYLNDKLSSLDKKKNIEDFSYFKDQYSRFINNTKEYLDNGKIELIREFSSQAFPKLIEKSNNKFDFIYIDGDHRPESVYQDAINSFELCKKNGYILFDDYKWCDTHIGIDKFLEEFQERLIIVFKNYQVLIQKL
jgi:predicted O-methyltransferase YrrM